MGFPDGSEVKVPACNVGDPASIHGSGRSPGEGNGTPLQYSCLENPVGTGAWQGVAEWDTAERRPFFHFTRFHCSSACGVLQNFIPSCERAAFVYLFISWRTFSLFGTFRLLPVMLLWTFMCIFLRGYIFSFFLSIYLRVEVLSHLNIFRHCQIVL